MVAKALKEGLSIIISGWPAVGKTTMAVELAKEFKLKTFSGGDILKMLAESEGYSTSGDDWWDTDEAKEFMEERKSNPSYDREVDRKLIQIIKSQNAVVTSYTLPWLVDDDAIKFWLKGSQDNRALRMANRDNISYGSAKKIIQFRDEQNRTIYRNLYNFNFGEDLKVFDFCLNTDLLSLPSLIEISKSVIRRLEVNQRTQNDLGQGG
ncbi:MAG: cytidylate kinase family protein [Thermoproteota archaeon]|nr:cytidylate kinase family protein [Thermoproteota archaeon]